MLITRIVVSGLFDRFDHDLAFKPDEQIIIMIGPNGFGKTMTLRILNTLFNRPVRTLAWMPFQNFAVHFDDGSQLTVLRTLSESEKSNELELIYQKTSEDKVHFKPEPHISPSELGIPIRMIENIIPELDQVGPQQWRHIPTDELFDLDDVIHEFGNQLPWKREVPNLTHPDWLAEIRKNVFVRFIDTERLTERPTSRSQRASSRWQREHSETLQTVRRYSDELGERVKKTLSDYGSLAQSLDRTFPVRLVEEPSQMNVTMEHLRQELDEVEAKRVSLIDAGLLVQEHEGSQLPSLGNIDDSRRSVLSVYAKDTKQKLSIFDDLYSRIDALKRISNSRLLYKKVSVGENGLSVTSSNGLSLDLEMLSSGEQHELVILYELLFRVPDNSFILFDEPELSLHVAWQEMFLEDLEEMAKISKFQILLATHSPQIIGDRWDLTVELKGPNEK